LDKREFRHGLRQHIRTGASDHVVQCVAKPNAVALVLRGEVEHRSVANPITQPSDPRGRVVNEVCGIGFSASGTDLLLQLLELGG